VPAARYADLETGSRSEMPILQEGPLCAAGAFDQTHRNARDHALRLGASGRGEVTVRRVFRSPLTAVSQSAMVGFVMELSLK
jgi:hypothetical protein